MSYPLPNPLPTQTPELPDGYVIQQRSPSPLSRHHQEGAKEPEWQDIAIQMTDKAVTEKMPRMLTNQGGKKTQRKHEPRPEQAPQDKWRKMSGKTHSVHSDTPPGTHQERLKVKADEATTTAERGRGTRWFTHCRNLVEITANFLRCDSGLLVRQESVLALEGYTLNMFRGKLWYLWLSKSSGKNTHTLCRDGDKAGMLRGWQVLALRSLQYSFNFPFKNFQYNRWKTKRSKSSKISILPLNAILSAPASHGFVLSQTNRPGPAVQPIREKVTSQAQKRAHPWTLKAPSPVCCPSISPAGQGGA